MSSLPYDLINPSGPTKPSSVMVVSTLLPALAILAVLARFNIHRSQKAGLKLDDWTMVPASLLVIGMGICGILGVHKKVFGYHSPKGEKYILDPVVTYEQKLYYSFQWIQLGALLFIKLGALAFYHRIFCSHGINMGFSIICYATGLTSVLWAVGVGFGLGFECGNHISAFWHTQAQYLQYCVLGGERLVQGYAISNFCLDLWILLLPVPKILHLNVSWARKIGVCGVFLLAAIGLAASLARMIAIIQEFHTSYSALGDYRLQLTLIVFWSNLEAPVCLLAVNLPSLWSYRNSPHLSPSHILASIRSALSLQSSRSTHQQNSSIYLENRDATSRDGRSSISGSSHTKMFDGNRKTDSHAVYDVEAQDHTITMPLGAIKVDSAVLQTRDP